MARFDARMPGDPRRERLDVRFDEIVLVCSDLDYREFGNVLESTSSEADSEAETRSDREARPLHRGSLRVPAQARELAVLDVIAYRVGAYGDFRESLFRSIDAAAELRAWTHREPDDPGIALLEGAAVLGDILTFYQQHYANEVFLRTATWREKCRIADAPARLPARSGPRRSRDVRLRMQARRH